LGEAKKVKSKKSGDKRWVLYLELTH
jgi:hypothetical protein